MRTVEEHMSDLGIAAKGIDYRKLSKLVGEAVEKRDKEDLEKEARFDRLSVKSKHVDWLQKAIEASIEKERDEINGEFPIISTFEALQIAKTAVKKAARDIGLKNLVHFLEKKWTKDQSSNLITAEVLKLKDHFKRTFPKSSAKEVIDDFAKFGYSTLPVSDLLDIADRIRSQEDFDYYVREAGLHTNNPFAKKARRFILSIVNGEESSDF